MTELSGARVLITGGAGLIGSTIADLLVENEDAAEVVIFDNFDRGVRSNIARAVASGRVTVVEGDVRDRDAVDQVLDGTDVVFHQAALRITQCAEEPRVALEVLVDGAFNVIEGAARHGVHKVVAASSASIYGQAELFPTREDHHAYDNRTFYGAAKLFNEGMLRSFADMSDLDYIALRYFNVYGPRMDMHGVYTEVLIRWMERLDNGEAPLILGAGDQSMDFIFVDDIARANILAAKSTVTDQVYNIASGAETSLEELAAALMTVMDREFEPIHGPARKVNPVHRRLADTSAAALDLGFTAEVDLSEGLRRLVDWWRAERGHRRSVTVGATSLDAREVVIVCAATPWTGHRGSDHHIADHLRDRTAVLWVDPPVSHVTLARSRTLHLLRGPRLRVLAPDLAVLSPLVLPAMRRPIMNGITERLVRHQIRRAIRTLGVTSSVRIVASDLMLFEEVRRGAAAVSGSKPETRVLYAMDDLAAGAELIGVPATRIRRNENRQGARSDLVIAVSPALRDKWSRCAPSIFIPNGCASERFADVDELAPAPDVTLPGPVAGLVGYLSDRLDYDLLEAVADRGISVLLVGKRSPTAGPGRLDEFLSRPNVQWVGPKPFEQMATYLRAIDVGLTPYSATGFNRASFPLKTLEYLAAGRGAVVTDLPAHRWLDTGHIDIASDPDQFADSVSRRLTDPLRPDDVARRREFARAHSWGVRADQFAEAIGLERSTVAAGGRLA